jgi:hypothetical protein
MQTSSVGSLRSCAHHWDQLRERRRPGSHEGDVARSSPAVLLSGRADSNRRPPAPKLEPAQVVYQQKHSFLLLRANIRSHTGTVWFGRVPLVLLLPCYLEGRRSPSMGTSLSGKRHER